MSGGDHPKSPTSIQRELNRQALVELGKRLTGLEHQFVGLTEEVHDLKHMATSSLQLTVRLQGMLKELLDRAKSSESQEDDSSED